MDCSVAYSSTGGGVLQQCQKTSAQDPLDNAHQVDVQVSKHVDVREVQLVIVVPELGLQHLNGSVGVAVLVVQTSKLLHNLHTAMQPQRKRTTKKPAHNVTAVTWHGSSASWPEWVTRLHTAVAPNTTYSPSVFQITVVLCRLHVADSPLGALAPSPTSGGTAPWPSSPL